MYEYSFLLGNYGYIYREMSCLMNFEPVICVEY